MRRSTPGALVALKMLMLHVREFWFRTHARNLETEEEREEEGESAGPAILAWIQVETPDLIDPSATARKATKNLKWHARKVDVPRVVLHSFAHLSDDRAEPTEALRVLEEIAERLRGVGFEVLETPWGHFNEFRMHVEGPGIAKVWKSW